MKVSEGKAGRVFFLRIEPGDDAAGLLHSFAAENGVQAGQISLLAGDRSLTCLITPDASGIPGFRLPAGFAPGQDGCDIVVQEFLGLNVRRVTDPASGREVLTQITSPKTRVMEKPAPVPEETGPGTVPVYVVNAEFN